MWPLLKKVLIQWEKNLPELKDKHEK